MLRISPGNERNGNDCRWAMFGVAWSRGAPAKVAISFVEWFSISLGDGLRCISEVWDWRRLGGFCSPLVEGEGGSRRRTTRLRKLIIVARIHSLGERLQTIDVFFRFGSFLKREKVQFSFLGLDPSWDGNNALSQLDLRICIGLLSSGRPDVAEVRLIHLETSTTLLKRLKKEKRKPEKNNKVETSFEEFLPINFRTC